MGGQQGRHHFADYGGALADAAQAVLDQLLQLGAFARAVFLQFLEGLIEQLAGLLDQVTLVRFLANHHARPGQQLERVDRAGVLQAGAELLGGADQLVEQWLVKAEFAGLLLDRVEAQGALDLAAGQLLAQQLAQRAFQFAEGFGQAQGDFQIAVVHRPQFPGQVALIGAEFAAGEGGHAVNHADPLSGWLAGRHCSALRRSGGIVGVLYSAVFPPAVQGFQMMKRPSERAADQMRQVTLTRHYTKHAEGSVLVEFGDTKVICTVSVEAGVPRFLRGSGQGWITAEYGMLPRSTGSRMQRESSKGKQGGRTLEIQRLIGRSLRAAVDLKTLGENTLYIDCDVIQADGGTRTASITGACVALVDALRAMKQRGAIKKVPEVQMIAAISVGIYQGVPVLDLDYPEDSAADTDLNVVMTDKGGFIEVQGTAEAAPFSAEDLNAMLTLARKGTDELFALQRAALED